MAKRRQYHHHLALFYPPLHMVLWSCGVLFVLGNLYVLHTGFSQAYHDLELAATASETSPGWRPWDPGGDVHKVNAAGRLGPVLGGLAPGSLHARDQEEVGKAATDMDIICDLPIVALTALGYKQIKSHDQGDTFRPILEGKSNNLPSFQKTAEQPLVESQLRKLMGNQREPNFEPFPIQNQQQQVNVKSQVELLGHTRMVRDQQKSHSKEPDVYSDSELEHHSVIETRVNNNMDKKQQPHSGKRHIEADTLTAVTGSLADRLNDGIKRPIHVGNQAISKPGRQPGAMTYRDLLEDPLASPVIDLPGRELHGLLIQGSQCSYVQSLVKIGQVGSGWTKSVYSAHLPDARESSTTGKTNNDQRGGPIHKMVALKMVDSAGHDVRSCQHGTGLSHAQCYVKASHKMLREILIMGALQHDNIIKMLAYCVPDKSYNGSHEGIVSIVTELGEPLDIIRLLQMSWEERLRVSYGITRLLAYLAQSPLGAASLNDFRRQQFVLVRDDVALTDLDDVSFGDPRCDVSSDCRQEFPPINITLRTRCVHGRCEGLNEKKNLANAAHHFTSFLLPHGAPPALRPQVDAIVSVYSNATKRAGEVLALLDQVVERYSRGDYLNRSPSLSHSQEQSRYTVYHDADLPGLFDYKCRYSIASSGCTLSVADTQEAESLCDQDPVCRAFVISNRRTWTGRMVIHLKNNVTASTSQPGMQLCVKPG